jgi:hypothetical protein
MIEPVEQLGDEVAAGECVGMLGSECRVCLVGLEAAISYYVATIQIVNQKEAVPFSVVDSAGQPVTQNVYATNVTVWNSGDLTIDPQNVRSPLTISLTKPVRLIDATIDHTTDENISGFKIANDPKATNNVEIRWRYFDPKDAFRLRFIYSGNEISNVAVTGNIYGVSGMQDRSPPLPLPQPVTPWTVRVVAVVFVIMLAIIFNTGLSYLGTMGNGRFDEATRRHMRRSAFISFGVIEVFTVLVIMILIWLFPPVRPPF